MFWWLYNHGRGRLCLCDLNSLLGQIKARHSSQMAAYLSNVLDKQLLEYAAGNVRLHSHVLRLYEHSILRLEDLIPK
jgi:hypothetical protein